MIWCFSISRPRKNYRKWTWETSCVCILDEMMWVRNIYLKPSSCSHMLFFASKCKCWLMPKLLSESKSILCLRLIGFGCRSLNESLILNHTTIVTNSMPNPFSSFHISLWWCPKSVGVHKWQRWPWFISGRRASRGQLTSRYISCFLTWNNKTRSKTSNGQFKARIDQKPLFFNNSWKVTISFLFDKFNS